MSITLRRIRSFIAVAELGGFRRAADELAVSQPALSAHVSELEEMLGVPLFRRTTRRVQLTPTGEQFLARVKRTVGELESVIMDVKEQAAIQRGRVLVAAVPSIAANVLPEILSSFVRDHPNISVEICDDRAEVNERHVLRSEADFAIGPALEGQPDLEFEHVVDDPFLAIFPKSHPLAGRPMVALRDFLNHPVIAMRPGLNMRMVFDHAVAKAGLSMQPAHQVYHHDTLTGLVEAGLGIGAMPALTVSIVRQPGFAMAPLADPPIARQIGFITRRGELMSPAARQLAGVLRTHLLDKVGQPLKPAARKPRKRANASATPQHESA